MTLEERLVDLFGLGARVPEDATLAFEWGYLPQGDSGFAFVVTFLVAVALTVFFYRKEGRASRARKVVLGALRLAIFAWIALILCEPRHCRRDCHHETARGRIPRAVFKAVFHDRLANLKAPPRHDRSWLRHQRSIRIVLR